MWWIATEVKTCWNSIVLLFNPIWFHGVLLNSIKFQWIPLDSIWILWISIGFHCTTLHQKSNSYTLQEFETSPPRNASKLQQVPAPPPPSPPFHKTGSQSVICHLKERSRKKIQDIWPRELLRLDCVVEGNWVYKRRLLVSWLVLVQQ